MLQIITAFDLTVIILYVAFAYFLSRTIIYLDRQPVPKNPKDYGMDFQNIEFRAEDNVNLKGWLIPHSQTSWLLLRMLGA